MSVPNSKRDPAAERRELTAIYVARGLKPGLARQVADELMAHDALGRSRARRAWHLRDPQRAPDPGRFGSAASFAVGALLPLTVTALAPEQALIFWVSGTSLIFLALLGAIARGSVGSAL